MTPTGLQTGIGSCLEIMQRHCLNSCGSSTGFEILGSCSERHSGNTSPKALSPALRPPLPLQASRSGRETRTWELSRVPETSSTAAAVGYSRMEGCWTRHTMPTSLSKSCLPGCSHREGYAFPGGWPTAQLLFTCLSDLQQPGTNLPLLITVSASEGSSSHGQNLEESVA